MSSATHRYRVELIVGTALVRGTLHRLPDKYSGGWSQSFPPRTMRSFRAWMASCEEGGASVEVIELAEFVA